MTHIDLYFLDLIQNIKCPALDKVIPYITSLGNSGAIWILAAVIMLMFKKTRKGGIVCALSLLIGFLICNVTLKPLVSRPRPFAFVDFEMLIPKPSDYSFPSGHTTSAFAFSFALLKENRKWFWVWLIFGVFMGFTRLYLCVHFPSDVLVGATVGAFSGIASRLIVEKRINKI